MTLDEFLKEAWDGYVRLTPDAPRIHEKLRARGEEIVNDHVALRTFDVPGLTRFELGATFEGWGYRRADEELDFPEKKLKASYWLHPDPSRPKIFISELVLDRVSPDLRGWIRSFARARAGAGPRLLLDPQWEPVRHEEYERFHPESEYAAWTAAFGVRVNHFTVLVNRLRTFASLQTLNEFLLAEGFRLNDSGSVVKGTPAELLEQSSTMARRVPWRFAGGVEREVMGCYYEFARRYPLPGGGGLFPGFIPKSADKIFESTFEKRGKS
jgi:hypothetical protein